MKMFTNGINELMKPPPIWFMVCVMSLSVIPIGFILWLAFK